MKRRKARRIDVRQLYVELQALRPDLTQVQMAEEIGISLITVQRIASGHGVSMRFAGFFAAYVAKFRTSPWAVSPQMSQLRTKYAWFESQSTQVFKEFLDVFEEVMQQHRSLSAPNSIEAVFALWLLAWAAHDRAFRFKEEVDRNRDLAIARYDQAVARLTDLIQESPQNAKQYSHLLQLLRLARFVSFFMGQPKLGRSTDPRVVQAIKNGQVVEAATMTGERSMHEWSIHRNGLIAASILKDEETAWFFYERLVGADPRFNDPDFKPNNGTFPSLMEDTDLDFFRDILLQKEVKEENKGEDLSATDEGEGNEPLQPNN